MTESRGACDAGGRAAVFLDRDGTLITEEHYLSDPDRVRLLPGVADALARLAGAGFALVVVTNQSGIARGFYTEAEYAAVQRRLEELLAGAGVRLDGVYFCPHHPDHTGPCDCRKPATELFRRAARELGLRLEGAAFIGDRMSDLLPARELGGRGILVRTGYGSSVEAVPADVAAVPDLAAAADLLLASVAASAGRDE